jgi:hypothetical protein
MMSRICRVAALVAVLSLITTFPARAQDDLQATLVEIETSLWEAWKTGDLAVFEARLVENALQNGASGVTAGRAQLVDMMRETSCDVAEYSLSDFQLHRITDDTAILTYRGRQTASCAGETLPGEVWSSSVFVRQGGQWLNALYQETPIG